MAINLNFSTFLFFIRKILKHHCLPKQPVLHSSLPYNACSGRCFGSYPALVKKFLLKQPLWLLLTNLHLSTIFSSSQHFSCFLSLFIVLSFLFLKIKQMFSRLFLWSNTILKHGAMEESSRMSTNHHRSPPDIPFLCMTSSLKTAQLIQANLSTASSEANKIEAPLLENMFSMMVL